MFVGFFLSLSIRKKNIYMYIKVNGNVDKRVFVF